MYSSGQAAANAEPATIPERRDMYGQRDNDYDAPLAHRIGPSLNRLAPRAPPELPKWSPNPEDEEDHADMNKSKRRPGEEVEEDHADPDKSKRRPGEEVEEDPFDKIEDAANARSSPMGTLYTTTKEQEGPSKRVHILGYDPRAYYIASQIGGSAHLDPVKLLVHRHDVMRAWAMEGGPDGHALAVWRGSQRINSSRAKAEWIGIGKMSRVKEHIDQLVVTLPCVHTEQALTNIIDRIDNRTTICLVQDGLGVVEHLNSTLFQDHMTRPTFVLGHMTTSLGYSSQLMFQTVLKAPGRLYLTAVERTIDKLPQISFYPPIERQPRASNFLRTLVTLKGLYAGGYSNENFLIKKIPDMIFSCVVDPIAVILDTTYDQVLKNGHAMKLAGELTEELFNVIMSLPELPNASKVVANIGRDVLQKRIKTRLAEKGFSMPRMVSRVRSGKAIDIDFLNGYFVKRAEELGIRCPQNKQIINVIKARISKRNKELQQLVDFDWEYNKGGGSPV